MKAMGQLRRFMVSDITGLPPDWSDGCDLTFTDPPWEQGLVKMFETLNVKAGGDRPGNTIDGVLDALFTLAPAGCPAFIEYSLKGADTRVARIGVDHGFDHAWTHHGFQLNGRPYATIAFNTDMPEPAEAMRGWHMLTHVITYHQPECVFEPFAGHGQHARRIVALGADVVASELNEERASHLRKWFKI